MINKNCITTDGLLSTCYRPAISHALLTFFEPGDLAIEPDDINDQSKQNGNGYSQHDIDLTISPQTGSLGSGVAILCTCPQSRQQGKQGNE